MPTHSAYRTDHYLDSKSEATCVEDRRMPTSWEDEVHELRDHATNPYPTRPRDYRTTDDIIRQMRADTSDYHSEPSRRSNNLYNSLCCGSKVGVVAWIVAILGIAIALGVLLIRILKPAAFGAPADDPQTLSQASIVTVTESSPTISIITSTVSTVSTETESTVSTTTLITETTDSTTTTLTYTPPTTATETETATQTTTSMATITPPSTITVTPEPSTVSSISSTTSVSTATATATATITEPLPPNPQPVPELDGEDGADDDNDATVSDGGKEDKRDESSTTRDDKTRQEESQISSGGIQRGEPPGRTPLLSLQQLLDSASGSSRAVLSTQVQAAISFCSKASAVSRDSKAGSFCGPFPTNQGRGSPIPSTSTFSSAPSTDSSTTAKARRYFNVFARAAPLTTSTFQPRPDHFTSNAEVRDTSTPTTTPSSPSPEASNEPASPSSSHINGFITARRTTTVAPTTPTQTPTPPLSTSTSHIPTNRTPNPPHPRRSTPPKTGTHTIFLGRLDCVSQRLLCEFSLVAIGVAVGLLLAVAWALWDFFRRRALEKAAPLVAASLAGPLGAKATREGIHFMKGTMRG